MTMTLAVILKPFLLLIFLAMAIPFRMGIQKWLKQGKFKEFLLRRI